MTDEDEPRRGRPPVFLERHSYRRRRMVDAVRVLPFIGLVGWLVPLLWPEADGGEAVRSSSAILYLFGVWAVLVLGALGLSLRLSAHARETDGRAQDAAGHSTVHPAEPPTGRDARGQTQHGAVDPRPEDIEPTGPGAGDCIAEDPGRRDHGLADHEPGRSEPKHLAPTGGRQGTRP
ncbi:hypothetical protein GCM10011415_34540 [Salipiger pallidus]|uniref:Uncharacterized protein n=1 Tax=Salipiger pallidus TaxID=1775170 RepID=A0A8J3EHR1_9RHOB|nr:hypothetical protein [Salipiger pallidus]GGG81987.1 hypothetical protein GCM10011415_34540 [Salipiger pallidus]